MTANLDEPARLAAVDRLRLLDTPADEAFDRVARLAAATFQVPIGVVSLLAADRQWFKAVVGVDFTEVPREAAFCYHAIGLDGPLVVEDASIDLRWCDNPLVVGEPDVRFYAGLPLLDADGFAVGSLCVADRVPRPFGAGEADLLRDLAGLAEVLLVERARQQDLRRFHHLFRHSNDIITVIGPDTQVIYASPSNERVLGYPEGYRHPDGVLGFVHPEDRHAAAEALFSFLDGSAEGGVEPFVVRAQTYDGQWRFLECVATNLLDEPDVGGIVITSRDVSARQRYSEQLLHQASHDHLTGLLNRPALEGALAASLERMRQEDHQLALCYVDLDGFKAINDQHGHRAGDRLLTEVAGRLTGALRPGDHAGRLGGDEFVAVLEPVADADEALAVAEAIVARLQGDGDWAAGCTASVGVALAHPGDEPHDLLHRADLALYRAKEAGKGRAVVFT